MPIDESLVADPAFIPSQCAPRQSRCDCSVPGRALSSPWLPTALTGLAWRKLHSSAAITQAISATHLHFNPNPQLARTCPRAPHVHLAESNTSVLFTPVPRSTGFPIAPLLNARPSARQPRTQARYTWLNSVRQRHILFPGKSSTARTRTRFTLAMGNAHCLPVLRANTSHHLRLSPHHDANAFKTAPEIPSARHCGSPSEAALLR
ncbi:hypothetical protein DFH09DRAFT_1185966 [Mycena vulgaris]|nr:hypothetical protein DFH09DRAFT_1185966 [Mycena vulgaris]